MTWFVVRYWFARALLWPLGLTHFMQPWPTAKRHWLYSKGLCTCCLCRDAAFAKYA